MSGKRLDQKEKQRIEDLTAQGQTPHRIAGTLQRSPHTIRGYVESPDAQERIAGKLDVVVEKAIDSITEEDYKKASLVQKVTAAAICVDKRQLLRGQPTSINVTVLLDAVSAIREARAAAASTVGHGGGSLTQKAGCHCALCLPNPQATEN